MMAKIEKDSQSIKVLKCERKSFFLLGEATVSIEMTSQFEKYEGK